MVPVFGPVTRTNSSDIAATVMSSEGSIGCRPLRLKLILLNQTLQSTDRRRCDQLHRTGSGRLWCSSPSCWDVADSASRRRLPYSRHKIRFLQSRIARRLSGIPIGTADLLAIVGPPGPVRHKTDPTDYSQAESCWLTGRTPEDDFWQAMRDCLDDLVKA